MLKVSQVSRRCGVGTSTVLCWIKFGVGIPGGRKFLPATRAGRSWRITENDLEFFLETKSVTTQLQESKSRKTPGDSAYKAAHKLYWDAVEYYRDK